jgi:hypothetical protein
VFLAHSVPVHSLDTSLPSYNHQEAIQGVRGFELPSIAPQTGIVRGTVEERLCCYPVEDEKWATSIHMCYDDRINCSHCSVPPSSRQGSRYRTRDRRVTLQVGVTYKTDWERFHQCFRGYPRLSIPSNLRLNEEVAAPHCVPLFFSPRRNDTAMLERYSIIPLLCSSALGYYKRPSMGQAAAGQAVTLSFYMPSFPIYNNPRTS